MVHYSKETLEKIKENAQYMYNNCGGCETCSQVFGHTEYDALETYTLIVMIEDKDKEIEELKATLDKQNARD